MPLQRLSQLHVGKVDGKHEYIETANDDARFFDTFLVPDTVNIQDFLSGERFLVRGFRGTGKTSLLRYLARKLRDAGADGQFVLFKSGLSESQRMEISKQAGIIKWEEVDSNKMEIMQDFKEAWRWFIHRKIAEILSEAPQAPKTANETRRYLKLMGVVDPPWFEKAFSDFPKIEAAKIKIKAAVEFIEAELQGDIRRESTRSVPISSLLSKLDAILVKLRAPC
jgi:hypothetical protein